MSTVSIQAIQNIIDDYITAADGEIQVLEAGCGSSTYFNLPDKVKISGIDISQQELSKNSILREKILGDIQTYSTNKQYDIVICWTVLEHLETPGKALSNLLSWTKPNGLIIIDVPNVFSLKGLITKFTPYWFHKWAYKNIFQSKTIPFPTYLRLAISPNSLLEFFRGNQIRHQSFSSIAVNKIPYNYFYGFSLAIIRLLTFGIYHPELSEFYLVIKKTT